MPTPTPPAIWSAPVNLGPAINAAASDQGPAISPDGLSLYFTSNRTGGLGGFDMYVSRRASVSDPWGAAVNIGSLNTTFDEGNPAFSRDGRSLFFQSKRLPSSGGIDIWVAQRNDPRDDFGWQPPVNLGPAVNSAADDNGPTYFEDIARGTRQLYFGSSRPGGPGSADIYVSEQMADGSFGQAMLMTELSSPKNENRPSIRRDGLEIFFQSDRTGSIGTVADLWVATRGSTLDAWSTPLNLGDTINTASVEQNAYLSSDGTTLFFASDRPGGFGGLDLYMSVRTLPTPIWSSTGNLNTGRDSHTATLLPNGQVLVAGGNNSNGTLKSAELYNPATGTWSTTGSLNTSRAFHTATLLPGGKVLVAGGFSCAPPPQTCSQLNSAELYDPTTGTWSNMGDLNAARDSHTATLLLNGKVLVAGGFLGGGPLNSVELYDPATGTWNRTGNLNIGRGFHTATLLPNGKVLAAGGDIADPSGLGFDGPRAGNSAELYDPTTGMWSATGNLNTERALHTSTLLLNGHVLVAGGVGDFGDGRVTNSAELYDPATGTWSNTGTLNTGRDFHTATPLPGGKVLIAAGFFVAGFPNITDSAELYNPVTGTWSHTTSLNSGRRFHTATLLLNGKVLVAGGSGFNAPNSAELYVPGTNLINPIGGSPFFIRQQYLDFLNREPEPEGMQFYLNILNGCGASDVECVKYTRGALAANFFRSPEFQQKGSFVMYLYMVTLGQRAATVAELGDATKVERPHFAEFVLDLQAISEPNDDKTIVSQKKDALTAAWLQRPEVQARYGALSDAQFVQKLLGTAGVTLSNQSQLVADLNAGTKTRAQVLRIVVESAEVDQKFYKPAFVTMEYFGFLRRDPEDCHDRRNWFGTQDGSGCGYIFHNNRFQLVADKDLLENTIVRGFIESPEYRGRFGGN
jgi:Tol biopolymer transport system component